MKEKNKLYQEQAACQSERELEVLGTERGYSNPKFWAKKIWEARQKKKSTYNNYNKTRF